MVLTYNIWASSQDPQQNQQQITGYEIPARLKTLHNLVIQYASQGRQVTAVIIIDYYKCYLDANQKVGKWSIC